MIAEGSAEEEVGNGRFRFDFDGLTVFGDGLAELGDRSLVIVLKIAEGSAEEEVGNGRFRFDFDGLAVFGDGLVQLALSLKNFAESVMREAVLR